MMRLYPACRTCVHWQTPINSAAWITDPHDPDTGEPMELPFEVRECKHPNMEFCERPLEDDGFAVADGSAWWAGLITAENFGCVKHEAAK